MSWRMAYEMALLAVMAVATLAWSIAMGGLLIGYWLPPSPWFEMLTAFVAAGLIHAWAIARSHEANHGN